MSRLELACIEVWVLLVLTLQILSRWHLLFRWDVDLRPIPLTLSSPTSH